MIPTSPDNRGSTVFCDDPSLFKSYSDGELRCNWSACKYKKLKICCSQFSQVAALKRKHADYTHCTGYSCNQSLFVLTLAQHKIYNDENIRS